jgi:hypothetical protein
LAKPSIPKGLLSEKQVLDALRKEVEYTSLTGTARKYCLQASQVSDVLSGRASLSKRMIARMSLKLVKFYEKVERNGKDPDFTIE